MNNASSKWLATYLYYAEPWESFLSNVVKHFIEKVLRENLAEQFFFIRYWEKGPHIRLRFKGRTELMDSVLQPRLEKYFHDYFNIHPSRRDEPEWIKQLPEDHAWLPNNSVQFIEYEPEIERYGGPNGILISERQFQASSQCVLEILSESEEWDYQRALGAAIQMHLGLAYGMGMSLYETTEFYRYVAAIWMNAHTINPTLTPDETKQNREMTMNMFKENFEKQKDTLVAFHGMFWHAALDGIEFEQDWLNNWINNVKNIFFDLRKSFDNGELIFPIGFKPMDSIDVPKDRQMLWSIYSSYVHMTNNRLGILNRDESYLAYLMQKSLEIVLKTR